MDNPKTQATSNTRRRPKTNKTKLTTEKSKKMSSTDSTGGEPR